MNREERLTLANAAVTRATDLAHHAESAARTFNEQHRAAPFAAAGSLWADLARTHAAIAAILPETEPTDG